MISLSSLFQHIFLYIPIILATCVFSSQAFSDSFDPLRLAEIHSSPNPVGSGARALGMGGAFIAVADDATAASWNPGGLIQLETPEISVVGAYFNRTHNLELQASPQSPEEQNVSDTRLNYISITYPFTLWHRNMVVSLNYQNLYDFTGSREFEVSETSAGVAENSTFSYQADGSLSALGIAYAIQVIPPLSFGVTLNLWEDGIYDNEWHEKRTLSESGVLDGKLFTSYLESNDTYSFSGVNANFGFLWRVGARLTVGAVLKMPFEAEVHHSYTSEGIQSFPDLPETPDTTLSKTSSENITLDMPISYGIGLAYRFSDDLTVSADCYRTEWDDFISTDSEGNKTSPITGKSIDDSSIDPTYQIRTGAEYLIVTNQYAIPLRGGLFYDPAPAEGSPDDYYGFSLGSGIAKGRWVFDASYQYRFGNDVSAAAPEEFGASLDVSEHSIYASMIVYFD